jgi:IS30 family transposase
MWMRSDSPAGVRFFAALAEGRGLKTSAPAAGIGKGTASRWVREAFTALRDEGFSIAEAQAEMGFSSSLMPGWDAARAERGDGRHHLRRAAEVEEVFWVAFKAGATLDRARRTAGVGRSTAYRWWQARFVVLREAGVPVCSAAGQLRLPVEQAHAWEAHRGQAQAAVRRAERDAVAAATRCARAHAQALMVRRARTQVQVREEAYWALMRQGMSNTQACKILGVHRKTGQNIRRREQHQTRRPRPPDPLVWALPVPDRTARHRRPAAPGGVPARHRRPARPRCLHGQAGSGPSPR